MLPLTVNFTPFQSCGVDAPALHCRFGAALASRAIRAAHCSTSIQDFSTSAMPRRRTSRQQDTSSAPESQQSGTQAPPSSNPRPLDHPQHDHPPASRPPSRSKWTDDQAFILSDCMSENRPTYLANLPTYQDTPEFWAACATFIPDKSPEEVRIMAMYFSAYYGRQPGPPTASSEASTSGSGGQVRRRRRRGAS
ncbi:hypothetical protein KSP39_PZI001889 [Platanthera zijinensis]|uniref:Uncharacterized protein n=1 Tax=Platanthera zijinensis TaxID=2320716 RepID=A0AAP0GER2_9ASPA